MYLTLAPYGGNLSGIRAATRFYFDKEPAELSDAQAALLVALPRSPEQFRPDRDLDAAKLARDRVLARLAGAGVMTRSGREGSSGGTAALAAPARFHRRPATCRPAGRGRAGRERDPEPDRWRSAAPPAIAGAAPPAGDGEGGLGCHPGGGECHAVRARLCRFGGFLRLEQPRPERHGARNPLAGIDPQASRLWARLRRSAHPSRDHDRRCAHALRRLRAAEFRSPFPWRDDGARGVAAFPQRAGGGAAQPRRPGALCRSVQGCGPAADLPGRRSRAGPADRSRRCGHQPAGSGGALCRHCRGRAGPAPALDARRSARPPRTS